MNICLEVYKNILHTTDDQTVNVIKKSKYVLSNLKTNKEDSISIILDDFFYYKAEGRAFSEIKKLINMIIYMIQTDKMKDCFIYINNFATTKAIENILNIVKFSGIINRFHIMTKKLNDNNTLIKYPELNIEIAKKSDIIFEERYLLDMKQEYLHQRKVKNENKQ